ncbi:MAG: hypothetical protein ACOH5I_19190 [Oligoflexus sp.]
MKNLASLTKLLFLLSLISCNGAEFSGSRSKGGKTAPPVIICDDDKGCDPSEDPNDPNPSDPADPTDPENPGDPQDPNNPDPCTVGDEACEEQPCEEYYEDEYTGELICVDPCGNDPCQPDDDDDDDAGQSDDDPSQSDDPSQRWHR